MFYKKTIGDDEWGYFIDIDDTPIHKSLIYQKKEEPLNIYKWLRETCFIIVEITIKNTIKHNCICSTIITIGSVMLCFIC